MHMADIDPDADRFDKYAYALAFDDTVDEAAGVLADRLLPALGASAQIRNACRGLVAAAWEWARLEIHEFNVGELEPVDLDRQDVLRKLMDLYTGLLPETDAGPIGLDLAYEDIRGNLVLLVLPGEWERLHTSFSTSRPGLAVEG